MNITRMFPSGGWMIFAMREGDYVTRRYFGYTKKEAQQQFRAEFPLRTRRSKKGQVTR